MSNPKSTQLGNLPHSATIQGNPVTAAPVLPVEPPPQAPVETHAATRSVHAQTQIYAPIAAPAPVPAPAPLATVDGTATTEVTLSEHVLPDQPPDPRLVLLIDPDSERAAAYRVLRHHLLELGRPQCVIVSSPGPGDGKTTTAINLALALGECGRARVLLVEAHLRRPQLASVLQVTPPWCFAEQLASHRQQPALPWSFVNIQQLWLHVGAVSPRVDRTQLLDGPAFTIAMDRLRRAGYDHIVIDAPPVLGSADVNLMAEAADTVLLAIRARRTTARDLRRAVDQIGAAKVAGTVLVEN